VLKIDAIIKDQFSLEMKNKEHEIEVIGQVIVCPTLTCSLQYVSKLCGLDFRTEFYLISKLAVLC